MQSPSFGTVCGSAAIAVVLGAALAGCAGYAGYAPRAPGESSPSNAPLAPSAKNIRFTFQTLDDPLDTAFNEILGINNERRVAGFYGSGAPSDPTVGYVAYPPYQLLNYRLENYPLALDTHVTSLNNRKTIAGFFTSTKGIIFGFTQSAGLWTEYQDPHSVGLGSVTEILGVNDSDIAVGFYKSRAQRFEQPFKLRMSTGVFTALKPPNAVAAVATGIDGRGDIVGYERRTGDVTVGFLLRDGAYTTYSYPRAKTTRFLGVTILDRIAGSYVDAKGATHGFLLTDPLRPHVTHWQAIDDPEAPHLTVATGIDIHYDVAGYYIDSHGVTNGFLATPHGVY